MGWSMTERTTWAFKNLNVLHGLAGPSDANKPVLSYAAAGLGGRRRTFLGHGSGVDADESATRGPDIDALS